VLSTNVVNVTVVRCCLSAIYLPTNKAAKSPTNPMSSQFPRLKTPMRTLAQLLSMATYSRNTMSELLPDLHAMPTSNVYIVSAA
jgi:hypothetical protein